MLIVLLLSVIQGISEFLPISSSAHLLITTWALNVSDLGLSFDAAIHIGTSLALLIFFYKDFWRLWKERSPLLYYIVLATIPAALIGFMGDKWIESTLHQSSVAPLIVGIGMILFSFLLLYVDNIAKLNRDSKDIGLKDTLIVGVAQALALIPGTSRSGITMTAGLWRGLKREDAARFSFLLAAPISLGAGLYKAFGLIANPEPKVSMLQVGVGIVASGLVGLAVIKWLLRYLGSHNLRLFVVYRIAFGVLVIALWVWRQ